MTTGRARSRQPFLFVGNHPCLDFINTQMIVRGNPTDLLSGCEDLVAWLVQTHMVDKVQAAVVMTQWNRKYQEQLFEQGVSFRRTLRGMVARIVARKSIPDSAIASINHILSRSPAIHNFFIKKDAICDNFSRRQYRRTRCSPHSPRQRATCSVLASGLWSRSAEMRPAFYIFTIRQKITPAIGAACNCVVIGKKWLLTIRENGIFQQREQEARLPTRKY